MKDLTVNSYTVESLEFGGLFFVHSPPPRINILDENIIILKELGILLKLKTEIRKCSSPPISKKKAIHENWPQQI